MIVRASLYPRRLAIGTGLLPRQAVVAWKAWSPGLASPTAFTRIVRIASTRWNIVLPTGSAGSGVSHSGGGGGGEECRNAETAAKWNRPRLAVE